MSRFSPTYEEIAGLNRLLGRKGQYGILVDSDDTVKQWQVTASSSPNSQRNRPFPRFTVIIVTYNEILPSKYKIIKKRKKSGILNFQFIF